LKRIAYISSAAVHLLGQSKPSTFKPLVTESDIGSLPLATAIQSQDLYACYIAAKLEAETYLRTIASKLSTTWKFVILYPVSVCGPIIHPKKGFGTGNHSLDWGYGFLSEKWKVVPPVPMYNIVDVRDLAKVCVVSLENERVVGMGVNVVGPGVFSLELIADTIRELWPELDTPMGTPGKLIPDRKEGFEIGNELFAEAFELVLRSVEESLRDYVVSVRQWMERLGVPVVDRLVRVVK
jgi:nucleoside-diphosphate-sugar epimerase